jgi:YmgG-like glycine-zipper protein
MKTRAVVLPLVAVAFLGGCATVPSGPGVMALPGTGKSFDAFQRDGIACQQYANAAVGGTSSGQAAADSAATSAVAGAAIGAAAGAIIGSATGQAGPGAAIGAGTGLLFGAAAGSNTAGLTYYEMQRRYDSAYLQCMYAKGNQVPVRTGFGGPSANTQAGYPPYASPPNYPPPNTPPPSYPPPNTPPPRV